MLVNNAGTLHQIDIEPRSNILQCITFCVPVTVKIKHKNKTVAGVNKHWVMLNVLCTSIQSFVVPWLGLWWVGAGPHSWVKGGDTEICCWGEFCLLPSAWHISLAISCYFVVSYLASNPPLEMPICFHTSVEPDNILMIHLLSDKFYL